MMEEKKNKKKKKHKQKTQKGNKNIFVGCGWKILF